MSELDDAMEQHMAYIVLSIGRPFSFKDFLCFEVDEKEYKPSHGTVRNKFNVFTEKEIIELDYKTNIAFYTLKGHKFRKKLMTPNHTVVHNNPIYNMLQDLPLERQSIHDIRLKFKVPDIWQTLSFNTNFPRNKRSNDIVIPSWNKNNAIVRIMIHKTDLVSVIIGCSLQPIPLDVNGIIRFFNLVVRTEEKLQTIIDNSTPINLDNKRYSIPEYRTWIVTMWHFGRDALVEFAGERFSITVKNAQHILTRLYVKDFNGKNRIRIERQEYPKKTLIDAIEEKLGD